MKGEIEGVEEGQRESTISLSCCDSPKEGETFEGHDIDVVTIRVLGHMRHHQILTIAGYGMADKSISCKSNR